MNVNLRSLIGKLNNQTRSAVEAAAGLCLSRTHYDVEIEHFLLKALDATDNDLAFALKHFGVDRSRLSGDLTRSLDRLKSGNARTPALSPSLVKVLTDGWTIGSVEYGAGRVRITIGTDERAIAVFTFRMSGSVEALRDDAPLHGHVFRLRRGEHLVDRPTRGAVIDDDVVDAAHGDRVALAGLAVAGLPTLAFRPRSRATAPKPGNVLQVVGD